MKKIFLSVTFVFLVISLAWMLFACDLKSLIGTSGDTASATSSSFDESSSLEKPHVPATYQITYVDTKGISHDNPTVYTAESETITLVPITADGYCFSGWCDRNGNIVEKIEKGSTGDLTLKATWKPIEYIAAFVIDGVTIAEIPFTVETQSLVEPDIPAKEGYKGVWETYIFEAKDMIVNPVYSAISYTATFVAEGRVVSQIPFSIETESLSAPRVPTKRGYNGIWEQYTLGLEDITINAQYSLLTYSITYNELNGAQTSNPISYTVCSDTIELLPPTLGKYDFDAWYDQNGKKVTEIKRGTTGNIVLYAGWDLPFTFTVSNREVAITKYTGSELAVEIPSTIHGFPVAKIDSGAFSDSAKITSLSIPKTVKEIKASFENCKKLTAIHIEDVAAWCNIDMGNSLSNCPLYYAKRLYLNGSEVKNLVIPDTVIEVKNFSNCLSIESVVIGNSVEKIERFYGCKNLKSIVIPPSVKELPSAHLCDNVSKIYISDLEAWCNIEYLDYSISIASPYWEGAALYLNGELITDLVIPETVTKIVGPAFCGISSITSVTIPETLTSIGANAFLFCSDISEVYITDFSAWNKIKFVKPSSNPLHVGAALYLNGELVKDIAINLDLTGGVAFVNDTVFFGCSSLESVTISFGITDIGDWVFSSCSNLTSIKISGSVRKIGSAFQDCKNLSKVYIDDISNWCTIDFGPSYSTPLYYGASLYLNDVLTTDIIIPEGVTSIGDAFAYATCITSITIPQSLTHIAPSAFAYCKNLSRVYISDFTAWYALDFGSSAANPLVNGAALILNGEPVTDLDLLAGCTTIKAFSFAGCTSLVNVTIPQGITEIGGGAFKNCKNITTVTLPNSLTTIRGTAFKDCSNLKHITIPKNVNYIGAFAFWESGLESVVFKNPNGWSFRWSHDSHVDSVSSNDLKEYLFKFGELLCLDT